MMIRHLIVLALLFLVSACRKDESLSEPVDPCDVPGHVTATYPSIIVADTTNVIIHGQSDIVTEPFGNVTWYGMNLLGDCHCELALFVDLTPDELVIKLYPLNDQIRMHQAPIGGYSYTYHQDHSYHDFTGGVEHYYTRYLTNVPIAEPALDSVQITALGACYFKAGDTLDQVQFVGDNDDVSLWHSGSHAYEQVAYANDTLHFEKLVHHTDYLPQQAEYRYLVFLYDSPIGKKFGWIKLEFTSAEDVSVAEYALQR